MSMGRCMVYYAISIALVALADVSKAGPTLLWALLLNSFISGYGTCLQRFEKMKRGENGSPCLIINIGPEDLEIKEGGTR